MRAFRETSSGEFVSWGNWGLQLGTGLFIFSIASFFICSFIYMSVTGHYQPGLWIAYFGPIAALIWGGYYLCIWKKITIMPTKRKLTVDTYFCGIPMSLNTIYLLELQEVTIFTSKSISSQSGHTNLEYRVQLDKIICYETHSRRAAEENAEFLGKLLKLPVKSWLPSIDDWKKTPR